METVTVEVWGVLLPPDGAPCDEPAELPALLGPDGLAGAEELPPAGVVEGAEGASGCSPSPLD